MKRVKPNQRAHKTMLSAVAALVPSIFKSLGLSNEALATLAHDAHIHVRPTEHWRSAPFGTGRSHKGNARRAAKRKAVVRARKMGHA